MRRSVWLTLLALITGLVFAGPGRAQDAYPSRLVRLVVPALAGSTTDILARIVADQLAQKWGKPVIVENIAGGGMNVGGEHVARAPPDGHTLLVGPPAPIAINHMLYRDLGYSPKDFVAIALLAKIPNVLVVRNSLNVSSVKELIAYAKANPEKVTYATQGAGSTAHLTAAQLELLGGIKLVHVPYRGAQFWPLPIPSVQRLYPAFPPWMKPGLQDFARSPGLASSRLRRRPRRWRRKSMPTWWKSCSGAT